jgi:hypothetical protein
MNKLHMTAIAAIVAGAVTVGGVAISSSGGSAAPATTTKTVRSKVIAQRTASLDALEASLDRQLAESASTGAPVAQPAGQSITVVSRAGHDGNDDHGGFERGDDHGSGDD